MSADDPQCRIKLKTFHAQIVNDHRFYKGKAKLDGNTTGEKAVSCDDPAELPAGQTAG